MNIFSYIKQRWYLLLLVTAAAAFTLVIYWAEGSAALLYALEGTGFCLAAFIVMDFFMLRYRIRNMQSFLNDEDNVHFMYPLDKIYAEKIQSILDRQKKFETDLRSQHSDEIEFITKWVHDVKVPISAIKLMLENVEDRQAQQLEMQTLHIEQNIQKILFHIKSKRFYEDYTIKPADVRNMIGYSLKEYAVFFSYKKISLGLECEDFKVATDEKWCGYIISQIISNAVKYTPEGGSIDIKACLKDGKGIITIKNSGEGIDEIKLKNIFKRGFTQNSLQNFTSTGYGLYLSKKLADIMGHRLYVQSVPGESVSFILECSITKM